MSFNRENLQALCDNLSNQVIICLNGLDIEDLDENIFDGLINIEIVDLYNNKLIRLKNNLFRGLENLNTIRAYGNNLSHIEEETFRGLSNLNKISLYDNSIGEIPEQLFYGLSNLISLNLSTNNINELPRNIFKGLINLAKINLNNNRLKSVDKNIFKDLNKIEEIELSNNQIGEIDEDIFNGLYELKSLQLSNNELSYLPKRIFNDLTKLNMINCYHNKLDYVDEDLFSGLVSLKQIKFGSNRIRVLPDELFKDLLNVNSIHFNNNRLKHIGKLLFSGLRNLEKIVLSGNFFQNDTLELDVESSVSFISFKKNWNENNIDSVIKYTPIISNMVIIHEKYIRMEVLGKGTFSTVYKCLNKRNKKLYAIKKIYLDSFSNSSISYQEASILKELSNPYLIKFIEAFEQSELFYIVTEYFQEGDLGKQIENAKKFNTRFNFEQICLWTVEMIVAIAYLHSIKICHRDLKPQNVFTSNGHIKIGDLGLARKQSTYFSNFRTTVGTGIYMSPELIRDDSYDLKVDIWSAGIILYELLELKFPFKGSTQYQIQNSIINDSIPGLNNNINFLKFLIKLMLNKDVIRRPSSFELLKLIVNLISNYIII